MLGTAGDLAILFALGSAVLGSLVCFAAGRTGNWSLLRVGQQAARAYAAAMVTAVAIMEYALVTHDFSVSYVAKVGSRSSPLHITIVSLWSSLEGSILLWGVVLGASIAIFAQWSRDRDVRETPYSLGTMLLVGAFFAFLIAVPANPFTPAPSPVPADGPGPNPLLQNHALMVIHPPMLYLGYVGMTVPFGMAIGALLAGRMGPAWTQALRRALIVPWGFLTVGITLGGWWAYEVLGWGGYWAWDPVENASFLPWLTATGALHAAMLPSRRDALKGWTVVLVIVTFQLTLLGTFMTRSGVFNSVHSFTQSSIGPIFLGFLAVALVASVILLAARIDRLSGEGQVMSPVSRESMFLLNNLIFVGLTFTVLLGTTFPLVREAMSGVKLSVGEPYFNQVAIPAGITILFLMGVGPALPWGEPSSKRVAVEVGIPLGASLVTIPLWWLLAGIDRPLILATLACALFATIISVREMVRPIRVRMREQSEPLSLAWARAWRRGQRRVGGQIVHLGIIVMIVAIALSHAYQFEKQLVMKEGSPVVFEEYRLTYTGAAHDEEPHRTREIATVAVEGANSSHILHPALATYPFSMNPIGTPDVWTRGGHDLYLSLVSITKDSAVIHAYRNPGIVWLWIGAGIAALGTMLAAWPTRRSPAVAENRAVS